MLSLHALNNTLSTTYKDASIKVCKFNEGNGIAISNILDLFEKYDKIVNGQTNCKELRSCIHSQRTKHFQSYSLTVYGT